MNIPDKVKILSQDFTVKRLPKKKMKSVLGLCDSTKNVIELREEICGDKLAEVFIHEVVHGIAENLNMGLKEDQVNNLAVGLWGFLKDNGYARKMGLAE